MRDHEAQIMYKVINKMQNKSSWLIRVIKLLQGILEHPVYQLNKITETL
jgi:hypothetical protein